MTRRESELEAANAQVADQLERLQDQRQREQNGDVEDERDQGLIQMNMISLEKF